MKMKTVKNAVTRGFLIMVLTLMAMTAIDMVGNGAVFGTNAAQASEYNEDGDTLFQKEKTYAKDGKMKIPKNAKGREKKAAKKLNKLKVVLYYTWKKGRLVQLSCLNNGAGLKPAHLKDFSSLEELHLKICSSAWKNADFSVYKNLKLLTISDMGYIKKINLSKNKKLAYLSISGNTTTGTLENGRKMKKSVLKQLNLKKNSKLKRLSLGWLPISKLDLSKNKKLQIVKMVACNKISTLSVKGLPQLTSLLSDQCDDFKKCSVENCKKLNYINITGKSLTRINVKNCPKLSPHFSKIYAVRSDGKSGWDQEHLVLSYDNKNYNYVDGDWKPKK